MKFAYLVMTELRSLSKNINDLYKYIINHFDADVFICVQESLPNDHETIKLFDKNVIYSEIYQKPDSYEYFGVNNNSTLTPVNDIMHWNKESNLQIYINYHKMSNIIKNVINDYDYFITMRTDVSILFPFLHKDIFSLIPNEMYSFDTKYTKTWNGSGYSVFIPKKYIMNYLTCYYDVISNPNYKKLLINLFYEKSQKKLICNQEKFQKICFKLKNIPNPKYIKNTNLFYNATTLNDYTTWSKPIMHPKFNVICKYKEQCDEAYGSLYLWNSGFRWRYLNDCLFLDLPVNYKK